jgi:hypothetical protein
MLFSDSKYIYWELHVAYIWSIRGDELPNGFLTIMDTRAFELYQILRKLSSNPGITFSAVEFGYIPSSYDDLKVAVLLVNDLLGVVKLVIINHSIKLLP